MGKKVNFMKKPTNSRIATTFKRIFNLRLWLDYERIRSFSIYIGHGFKRMFVPQKTAPEESFENAIKRLAIDEKQLMIKQRALYRLSIIMCSAAALLLCYATYHLIYGHYKAVIISVVVTMIALVLAFRYHFWYFQIKTRQLGCSINEWYRQGLMGDKE